MHFPKTKFSVILGLVLFVVCQNSIMAQNVGIGTSNPSHKLHVKGDSLAIAATMMVISHDSSFAIAVHGESKRSVGGFFSGSTFGMRAEAKIPAGDSGNAHFASAFEATGSTLKNEAVNGFAFGNGAILNRGVVGSASGDGNCYGLYGAAQGTGTNYGIYASALAGTENWAAYFAGDTYIQSRLGIGTTSPSGALHVVGTPFGIRSQVLLPLGDADNAHFAGTFEASGSTIKNEAVNGNAFGNGAFLNRGVVGGASGDGNCYGFYGVAQGTGTNYGIYAAAFAGTENWAGYLDGRMNIKYNSGGAAGVHLHLHENASDDWARIRFENNSTTDYWDVAGRPNTTNATASLAFWYQGLGDVLFLKGDGNAILTGTLMQNSDRRLKSEISPLQTTIADLQKIQGYHYRWNDENRDQSLQTGFIAQELGEIMPELIAEDETGNLSVNYIGMIPHLVEVIKQQDDRIRKLEVMIMQLAGDKASQK